MKLACALLIVGLPFAVHAQTPVFENAQYLYANGNVIDVGYYGSPFFYDWNGDGLKDLIVGQYASGYVRRLNPECKSWVFLQVVCQR